MSDKASPPDRRETHHSQHGQQAKSFQHSAGQSLGDFWQLLQREAVFGLQLILVFSVSFTAVQLTRSWFSHTGMFAATPAAYSARVFWPENALSILPSPASKVPTASAKAATRIATVPQSPQPKPAANPPVTKSPAVSQAPLHVALGHSAASQPARVDLRPNRAYSWAAPRAKRQPSFQTARSIAPAVKAKRYQVAAQRALQTTVTARRRHDAVMAPLKKMLHEDYKVAKLKSYDEYMSWVRKTLKTYQGG